MARLQAHKWKDSFTSSQEDLLKEFYRPVLEDAVRYWRITGYFSSKSLLQVLSGIERLVLCSTDGIGHGQIKLITGFFMSSADLKVLANGLSVEQLLEKEMQSRFPFQNIIPGDGSNDDLSAELLAWLVKKGYMEIRVGIPYKDGEIISDGAIFHAKEGVIEDNYGDRLAFSGSINETPNGWTTNYETFDVYCSWTGDEHRVETKERNFLGLWENNDPGVHTFSLPEAFRRKLDIFAPTEGKFPRRLPKEISDILLEKSQNKTPAPAKILGPDLENQRRKVWSYILNVANSQLSGSERVGEATGAVVPWPHQQRAFQRLWSSWPPRLLIADEVGLGKTVQAGLLLRQAWLSGRAKRILVMAPASVLKQWQRELREKFALDWPIYTGRSLEWQTTHFRPHGEVQLVDRQDWAKESFILVSSHLMRRRDRQKELIDCDQWDLVVLDEAHHARIRRDNTSSGSERLVPNTMMQVMKKLSGHTSGLLLLTATPMQVSELEVWDLLTLLGMPSEWTEDAFQRFFDYVERKNPEEAVMAYLSKLWQSSVKAFGEMPENSLPSLLRQSPLKKRKVLRGLKDITSLSRNSMSLELRLALLNLAKSWTPIQGLISRHSRMLLRAYKQEGSINLAIGTRNVEDRFLPSTQEERDLYENVEDFISTQYAKAIGKKKSSVGFVMTIYRRRLASSVASLCSTLEKRRTGHIDHIQEDLAAAEDEELHQELDLDEEISNSFKDLSRNDELEAISCLIDQAKPLIGRDSKGTACLEALDQIFSNGYTQVIIFSQYSDTVNALKKLLIESGRTNLMSFTGSGGELLQKEGKWKTLSREDVKRDFKNGKAEILLCTDAAAEGLNFQFVGALINYDMPWNPMRVEQRIGRIDRIGQRYETMQIINLHLDGTVESDVYRALKGRIKLFENVVGRLQPILAKASSSISKATLTSRDQRENARIAAVSSVEQEPEIKGLDLDDALHDLDSIKDVVNNLQSPPLCLSDLEAILDRPELLPSGCSCERIGPFDFKWSQPGLDYPLRVTCNADYYEENSDSCELWAPGSPLFPSKLAKIFLLENEGIPSKQEFDLIINKKN